MPDIAITVENPIWCHCTEGAHLLKEHLGYSKTKYVQAQYGRLPVAKTKTLMTRGNRFFTGWLPRVRTFCRRNGYTLTIDETNDYRRLIDMPPIGPPKLPQTKDFEEFWPKQLDLIEACMRKQRGFIQAVMGFGKTVTAIGLISAYIQPGKQQFKSEYRALFLCPGISLVTKTVEDFNSFGYRVDQLGDGQKDISGNIVVSTMQTFVKLKVPADYFDIVIVDEAHLAMKDTATYQQILTKTLAPMRIAFTATPPEDAERIMISEGLMGPIIGTVDFDEAERLGITLKPKVELIWVPKRDELDALHTYRELYKKAIVENTMRNRKFVMKAKELVERGKTCLMFSSEKSLDHGERLLSLAQIAGIPSAYVHGSTPGEDRQILLKELKRSDLKLVIATRVWREGINIPNLGAILIAKGGKADKATSGFGALLQTSGRVVRNTDGKDEAIIVDCLDDYEYLAEHAISRLKVYAELGWL